MIIDKSIICQSLRGFKEDKKLKLLQNVVHSTSIRTASSTLSSYIVPEKFTYEVKCKDCKVKNQYKTGFCWLFAAQRFMYNRIEQTMSVYYWAFFDKLERCNYAMNCLSKINKSPQESRIVQHLLSSNFLSDGGTWYMFANILKKYGCVAETKFATTFHTKNTNELNAMLRKIMRLFASNNMNRIEANNAILKVLYACLGTPPIDQAIDIYDKLNIDKYRVFINSPMHPLNTNYTVAYQQNLEGSPKGIYTNITICEMKYMVLENIKNNNTVWFASDMGEVDIKSGIMDHDLYDLDLLFDIHTKYDKTDRLIWGESAPVHAMILCGVQLENNMITHWKVLNSWGEDSGKDGFLIMTDKWFEENVYQIVVISDSHVYTEVNKLPPWDPMGMLA